MIQLRLFHAAEPFQQIDQRVLGEGSLIVGRDLSADWVIPDETCEVSRRHCTFHAQGGRVSLQDTSANGVFLGDDRQPAPRGGAHRLGAYETIHIGTFMIVLEPAIVAANDGAPFAELAQDLAADALSVREDWDDFDAAPSARGAVSATEAAMLDAFCAGAGLDASSFVGEDPVQVMMRAGAIYKQMVLGLGDLMSERQSLKSDLAMDRTTIGAAGNNPFKWAPTRRVAIDLLRERKDGFLSGAHALKASFEDLKRHGSCVMAGARAATQSALTRLAPSGITEEMKALKSGLHLNKSDAYWRLYMTRHEALSAPAGAAFIDEAFKRGYVRRLRDLEGGDTRS